MLRSFSMSISLTALNIFAHWECACMRVLVCEVSIECVMLYASCHIPYALVCDRCLKTQLLKRLVCSLCLHYCGACVLVSYRHPLSVRLARSTENRLVSFRTFLYVFSTNTATHLSVLCVFC